MASLQAALTIFALVAMSSPLVTYAQAPDNSPSEQQQKKEKKDDKKEETEQDTEEVAEEEKKNEDENTIQLQLIQPQGDQNVNAKVDICHKPGTAEAQVLNVNSNAVTGHVGHGDYLIEDEEGRENCVPPAEPEEPQSCEIVSNETDYYIEGEHNAVLTWMHGA